MPPKFQSTFIPKGPVSTAMDAPTTASRVRRRDFISTIATFSFSVSVLLAAGVLLYNGWLDYNIKNIRAELDQARVTISSETVNELIQLDDRIVSTRELLRKHRVLSPLFNFLESSTPTTIRFTHFNYTVTEKGQELLLKGEASSYAALALGADILNNSPYFINPVFSDLSLDQRGNVIFSMTTNLDQKLFSYEREVELLYTQQNIPVQEVTSTTTATTTIPTN